MVMRSILRDPWLNELRKNPGPPVEMDTGLPALSATFVTSAAGAAPDFGTNPPGWYVVGISLQGKKIASFDIPGHPSQLIADAIVYADCPRNNGLSDFALFVVELTQTVSDRWTVYDDNGGYITGWQHLWQLNREPVVVDVAEDCAHNSNNKTYFFSLNVQPGDLLLGGIHVKVALPPQDPADDVAVVDVLDEGSYRYRLVQGNAAAGGLREVYRETVPYNWTSSSALVVALR
jgi:hypothetical protein